MVYKNTLEAIIENVKEIEELISDFVKNKKIPKIEMDLALEKVRDLYDVLLLLRRAGIEEQSGQATQSTEKYTESVDSSNSDINENTSKTMNKEKIPDSPEDKKDEEPPNPDLVIEKPDEAENDKQIVSDRFKTKSASIHDSLLNSQKYDDYSSNLKAEPISNIANSIEINDKFTFIQELFDGDTNKYNKTIEILNEVTNFNDAYNYLMGNFNWDMDSTLVQKILDLIRRKLIISKDE